MSKYSVLFEADRFHIVGPFRFPIFEDLTPGEGRKMEDLAKRNSKNVYESMKLARKIANDHKVKVKEALTILENIGSPEYQDYLFEYADDVEKLTNHSLSELEQKIEYVTIFMRFRGQVKLRPDDDWTRTTDWEVDDTEALTKKRLNQIYQLIIWERDGWPKQLPEGDAAEGNEAAAPAA